jgi:protocatechuate 3,4-dioxygenase beta subunit
MTVDRRRARRRSRRVQPARLVPLFLAGLAAAVAVLLAGSGSAGAAPGACPGVNRPNMLKIVAGSPQTAQLEKPFQTELQVTLANRNGCPLTGQLAGIWVDFSAPASGTSGTFASSGTNRATVGTNAEGVATAPTFTANDVAGSYSVRVDSDYGSLLLYLTNTASGVVASIAATGTTAQDATVNSRYGQPLQAQVLDADGRPVQGASVTFALGTGPTGAGASFLGGASQATDTTKANGQATSPPFVANATPGRFTATASVSGIATSATFTLANHAAATTVTATPDETLTATVETRYRKPLTARVVDANGQPVEGTSITFTLPSATSGAGATFLGGQSQASTLTDTAGRASSPPLVANKTAGRFTATAAVTGVAKSAGYELENMAGKPATLSAGGASGQSTSAGSRFRIPLAVTVTDAKDNPVAGALVTFAAPTRGASGHFTIHPAGRPRTTRKSRTVQVQTNDNGVAIAPAFTANRTPGGFIVTATASGQRAAFALVNRPRR